MEALVKAITCLQNKARRKFIVRVSPDCAVISNSGMVPMRFTYYRLSRGGYKSRFRKPGSLRASFSLPPRSGKELTWKRFRRRIVVDHFLMHGTLSLFYIERARLLPWRNRW